ncbi:MAG: T9SS type A sorting domain-containing protein [Bacteroidales bacterium]|nr:T9SS type A sorting domain-containing protein [Bacteroidales bacterium]
MRKRKILFGIIAAILLFGTYTAIGQNPDQGLNFLGPNNLAGRTRTIVIDQQAEGDAVVLYTAGVSGGLFKSENGGKTWMPVLDNTGNEFVLPISCMVQHEGKLLIGTGEGLSVSDLDNKGLIIPKGKGIYQYDPATATFAPVIAADQNLEYINKMIVNGGYLYFATNTGLFRATMGNTQYETLFEGGKVQDLEIASERLYFTTGADLYMIDSLSKGVEYLKVKTNHASNTSRVELTVAPTDENYVYLSVADANGYLEGVYMTNSGYVVEKDSIVGTIDTIAEVSEVDTIVSEINVVDSNISLIDTLVSELDTLTTTLIIDTIPEISEIVVSDTLITIDSIFSAIDSTTMDSIFTVSYDTTYVFDTTFTYIYDSLYAYTFDTTFAYDTNYAYIYDTIFTYDTTFAYKYDTLEYDYFNIYLTEWNKISTSTVSLFTSRNGWYSNTLAVSPTDPKKLYLGGSDLWTAQGLEGTNIYTWAMESNAAYGRPSAFYVHENIHDIAFLNDSVYYLATDGGIFKYGEVYDGVTIVGESGVGFSELNRGLTTTQFVSVAVANDGSVMGGALGHAMPYIKSRENSEITTPMADSVNHAAESIWYGNGSWGAISMIHQVAPTEKEVMFVGAEGADFGRATSDYFNSTNTQAWTTGTDFNNTQFTTSAYNPAMLLWENLEDELIRDSMEFKITAPVIVRRNGVDTLARNGFELMVNDTIMLRDQAHTDYPIAYRIAEQCTLTAAGIEGVIKNPIQSRLFVTAVAQQFDGALYSKVYMTSNATDFRKVGGNSTDGINWLDVANLRESVVRALAITQDGENLFIAAEETDGGSVLVRVRGLASADPNVIGAFTPNGPKQQTRIDTILNTERVITSIALSADGNTAIVTCAGEEDGSNLYYIANATADECNAVENNILEGKDIYSSLIEKETGSVFIGAIDGIYTMEAYNQTAATLYGLQGVPVTFIRQQTAEMKFRRATYYTGTNAEEYRFGKTKYPGAIYFATYGRGIYVDKTYVKDFENEIGINAPVAENINDVRIYPNPAASYANIEMEIANATNVSIRIFDMSGKVVYTKSLDNLTEGIYTETINCQNMQKGVYLINVLTESQMMTSKLIVK